MWVCAILMTMHTHSQSADVDLDHAVLLDIEGTTTPITFVHNVLFPLVRTQIESFLIDHWEDEECQGHIATLRDLAMRDKSAGFPAPQICAASEGSRDCIMSAVANVNWLMDQDRKVAALKNLQGCVWEEGYKSGQVRGE